MAGTNTQAVHILRLAGYIHLQSLHQHCRRRPRIATIHSDLQTRLRVLGRQALAALRPEEILQLANELEVSG